MALSTVLLLLTAVAVVVFSIRLARSPAKQVLDWWLTLAIVSSIAAGTWALAPHSSGYVAFGAMCALVLAPLRIDRAAQRSARAGHDDRALLLARIAAILHPFGPIGARPLALSALSKIRATGDVDEATLDRLGAQGDPIVGEWYRLLALAAAADAAGIRAALTIPSRRARMLSLGLGAVWIRAVAMTGSRSDVIEAIEEAERTDRTIDDPERRAILALEACAAIGEVDGVEEIGAALQERIPRGSVQRARAAALLARGERRAAMRVIDDALAAPTDPAVRRALEKLRDRRPTSEPMGDAIDRRARDLVTHLRAEAVATHALAPLAEGSSASTWATWALLSVIGGWFVVIAVLGDTTDPAHLARMGGLTVPITDSRSVVRIFTSTLVHFGIVHLVFNLYALVSFGRFVETFYGRVRFAVIWLVATITSGVGVATLADPTRAQVLVGASGAIFGLGGALAAAVGLRAELRQSHRGREELKSFAVLVGLQIVFDQVVPGVSGTAHICGLIGGAIAGALVLPRRRSRV